LQHYNFWDREKTIRYPYSVSFGILLSGPLVFGKPKENARAV